MINKKWNVIDIRDSNLLVLGAADNQQLLLHEINCYTAIALTFTGMETEGIYRLSGQNSKVAQLLKCCQNGEKNYINFIDTC